ncbi:HAD-IIIA family hydrolase [bacterium]|nr:HAD-IIIA family hydrolase [bacterium]
MRINKKNDGSDSNFPSLLLLDRDGVILEHKKPYILNEENVSFIPGSAWAMHQVARLGIPIAVITNQSPIGRGLISTEFVEQTNNWIKQSLSFTNEQIKFYFCPHRPDEGCHCRKPNVGMLERAMHDFNVDSKKCWLVGDHNTDMQAAEKASVGRWIHVLSGRQSVPSSYTTDVYSTMEEFVKATFILI